MIFHDLERKKREDVTQVGGKKERGIDNFGFNKGKTAHERRNRKKRIKKDANILYSARKKGSRGHRRKIGSVKESK